MDHLDIDFPSPVVGASKDLGHFVDRAAFERYVVAYREAMSTLPTAVASTVTTSFGPVRAYRFDTGTTDAVEPTPIVLLSGRDSATPMWAPALPALLGLAHPLYALDSLGGPGCSAQHAPLRTPDDQAAWVAEAVTALGLGRAHLVGHSLGGWLTAQVALRRPDVVASATVLDPPRVFTELRLGFVAAGLTAAAPVVPDRLRRRLVGWIAGAPMSDSDPVDRLGWTSIETFRARQSPPHLVTSDELARLEVPLLAILAGRSTLQDAEKAARGAAVVPDARVEVWPDVGHCLHAEQPGRLASRLRELVDGSGP